MIERASSGRTGAQAKTVVLRDKLAHTHGRMMDPTLRAVWRDELQSG